MKTLVVGDLHGQVDLAKAAIDTGYPVVFVGDYLDSFRVGRDKQVETIEFVLDCIRKDLAIGLVGNHDLSYMLGYNQFPCSGHSKGFRTKLMYKDLIQEMFQHLKYFTFAEGFLISHAGVSNEFLKANNITLDKYLEDGIFTDCGFARGGHCPVGGLLWCDWRFEFSPIPDQPQIVGHSRGDGIRKNGNSYCIDCLENGFTQGLLIEDGKAEVFDFCS